VKTIDWGTKQIDLSDHIALEFRPTELHLKQNGSTENEPSFTILLQNEKAITKVFGQVSLKMLNKAFGELGYQITKLY